MSIRATQLISEVLRKTDISVSRGRATQVAVEVLRSILDKPRVRSTQSVIEVLTETAGDPDLRNTQSTIEVLRFIGDKPTSYVTQFTLEILTPRYPPVIRTTRARVFIIS